jgi:hypothetical protein
MDLVPRLNLKAQALFLSTENSHFQNKNLKTSPKLLRKSGLKLAPMSKTEV